MKTEYIRVDYVGHVVTMDKEAWERIKTWLAKHGVEVSETRHVRGRPS